MVAFTAAQRRLITARFATPSASVSPKSVRCGRIDDANERNRIVSAMRYPVVSVAADRDFLASGDEDRDVLMWEIEEKLIGKTLPAHRQTIGDCVSHGWGKAIQLLVWREHLLAGTPLSDVFDIATEPTYALSRVEVGKGRLGSGDGSIGAWAAESVLPPYGVLERKKYPQRDLTTYSGSLAKEWGRPRAGLPDDLEEIARKFHVAMAPLIDAADEAKAALRNGYPIPICSGQGFTERRDEYGFCDPRGSWAHCMCVTAIATVKRGSNWVLAAAIQQSWGNSPTGPDVITLRDRQATLPQGVFLIEFDVLVQRILRERDSYAPAGPKGFVRLPKFVF